jgi:hypothetical protein
LFFADDGYFVLSLILEIVPTVACKHLIRLALTYSIDPMPAQTPSRSGPFQ